MARILISTLIAVTTSFPGVVAAELFVEEPQIRELIPGQNNTAAYLDITNEGTARVTLVGFVCDSIGAIEIHTTVQDRGMVRMEHLAEVVLPPGKTVRFRPGGLHLMLFEVTDLQEETEIHLLTSDGNSHRAIFRRISLLESVDHYEHNGQ